MRCRVPPGRVCVANEGRVRPPELMSIHLFQQSSNCPCCMLQAFAVFICPGALTNCALCLFCNAVRKLQAATVLWHRGSVARTQHRTRELCQTGNQGLGQRARVSAWSCRCTLQQRNTPHVRTIPRYLTTFKRGLLAGGGRNQRLEAKPRKLNWVGSNSRMRAQACNRVLAGETSGHALPSPTPRRCHAGLVGLADCGAAADQRAPCAAGGLGQGQG